MANNNERMIFGIGFDLATGVDEVIKQWEGKESKRLQKVLNQKPLEVRLKIKEGLLTQLKDFVALTKEVASAQKALNDSKKQELSIEKESANAKKAVAQARSAELKAKRDEATQNARITKTIHDAKVAQQKWTEVKKNGYAATVGMNNAYATQSSYLQRLITRMAAYMSIHQVISWVKQIKEVTAEFELQRISLGALIQDAYKASTIFERIKIQAVKSPYEVKDLVNYTKRLAAYGVEADELIGTMNRLADISAGLGADMDRIILAYGQIQAAGVLKGTELRQLTELGIPMVELLAQYYTTLRNETISTAEVFDMISKKEVPFEAVKDILTDLTDEGGRFFDMQSKQAETLAGQWSNMKDTLSIMFDEIGRTEEVQDMLYGWIDSVKWLAVNWELVWKQIKIVVYAYAGLKTAAILSRILSVTTISLATATNNYNAAQRLANATTFKANALAVLHAKRMQYAAWATMRAAAATNFATKALWKLGAAMTTSPIGWIMGFVGAFAAISLMFSKGTDSMEKFKDSLEEASKEAARNTASRIANFERLVRVAANSADGSERQREALRRLNQQYGEIFTAEELEIENLKKIADGAEDAGASFDSLAASIKAFDFARFEQEAIEQYYTKLEEQFKNTFETLTDEHGDNYARLLGELMRIAPTWDENTNILKEVFERYVKEAGIEWFGAYDSVARDILNQHVKSLAQDKDLLEILKRTADSDLYGANKYASQEILLLYELAQAYANANKVVAGYRKDFEDLDPAMSKVLSLTQQLAVAIDDIEVSGATEEQIKEAYDKELSTLVQKKRAELVVVLTTKLSTGEISVADKQRALEYFDEEANQLMGIWDDKWREDMSDMVSFLDEGNRKVQVYSKDQIKGFTNLDDALDDAAKRHKELSESQEQLQKTANALDLAPVKDEKLIETYRKEITKNEEQLRLLYEFLEKYGALDRLRNKDKKVDPRIKQLEEELSMVEKIYKKYQDYRKMMGAEEARAMTEEYFKGVDFQWLDMAFSPDDLRAQSEEALRIVKTFWGDTKKAQQNIQFKIGDIDYNETKRELEQKMKRLSDDISRTKTAKEFFDRMLGLTGNKELSATLTLSVYGTTGDDLQALMVQQVEEAFRNLPKDINFDSARLFGNNRFDYNILAGWIDKLPEDDRKVAQSIVDNWRKANADILSDIQKSYEEFMTYEERRTRVAEKYAAERKKIMESELPDDEKEKYVKAANKRENKELTDIAIEEFKASEDWAKSFEDLENLATPTIERLMAKLKEFIDLNKEEMTPEQVKTLTNEYKKLYDGLIQRNPFKAISDGVKEYKLAIQGIKFAQEQLDAAIAIGDEELIAFAERGLTDAFDEAQKATNKLKKGVDTVGDKFSQAASDIQFFANALGFSEDSYATQFLNGMANAFKGVSIAIGLADVAMKMFDGSIKAMFASNPIGWILLAVSGIIAAVQAIMNARINRINKEIEALEDKLDNLEYAYDRLQKSAEKTFGTEYIQNYQRQLDNLEAQVEAYEKQLDLERSKGKKADEEKIKEYQDKIRDTKDAIEDMYGSLSEHFLGTDLTSAARDFASAWIEAYKSFSNTSDAMKEKFQEMIQNMIVESLIAKVMERALRPVFDMVDNMGDSDFYSNSFWSQLMTEMNKATENGVVGAQNIMGMLESIGINLRDTGTGLTGISRDIASASEESILGLAAGINTQNFYISQVPTKLDTIIGLLRGGSAVVDSGVNVQDLITIQNQFLSHLPTIAQNTAETVARCERAAVACESMASKLGSVIKPKGTTSTHSVNVTIGS